MKRRKLKRLLICLITLLPISLNSNNDEKLQNGGEQNVYVTLENFPVMDCSTSTQPLITILAAKLLGLPYKWWNNAPWDGIWYVEIDYDNTNLTEQQKEDLRQKLNCSTTHGSYTNLVDDKVELIIASRGQSRDEKAYAEEKGVQLIERPVGRDAFIFIVNEENKVRDLSISQIQGIYTARIRNWGEVGGNDATINPYIREANSGSQEKMETLVMKGLTMIDWPEMRAGGMAGPYYSLRQDKNGIAYTPFYYFNIMAREWTMVKSIAVNGVEPSEETINDNTYPYVSEIYAAVRADIDKSSTAYLLFEYLTTQKGQEIVEESGYIPLSTLTGISIPQAEPEKGTSVKYTDLLGRPCAPQKKGILIETTIQGSEIISSQKILVR